MVDNERLEARKADNVVQESQIPLTCCCSSCSAVTQGQAAQLNIAGVQGICQTDAAIDIDDNKSIRPSANTSDGLRDIIIDGSNVAMRLDFFQCYTARHSNASAVLGVVILSVGPSICHTRAL